MEGKRIHFVSWKKHKVDQALTQVDNVYQSFIDELIFETVLDCCRASPAGYPQALPISDITCNEQVLPPLPLTFQFEARETQRPQICPVCKERVPANFTAHLHEKCFTRLTKKLDVCVQYFEEANAQQHS